jgi:hypothetical protein
MPAHSQKVTENQGRYATLRRFGAPESGSADLKGEHGTYNSTYSDQYVRWYGRRNGRGPFNELHGTWE